MVNHIYMHGDDIICKRDFLNIILNFCVAHSQHISNAMSTSLVFRKKMSSAHA